MSGDAKRNPSVLSGLKRPLLQGDATATRALEEHLLGPEPSASIGESQEPAVGLKPPRVPTVPVTFHLPIDLRDKLRITAQAKQKTMVEMAIEALRTYLEKNAVSEADLRRMLGM
jgi:hypothetical protein